MAAFWRPAHDKDGEGAAAPIADRARCECYGDCVASPGGPWATPGASGRWVMGWLRPIADGEGLRWCDFLALDAVVCVMVIDAVELSLIREGPVHPYRVVAL